MTSKEFILWLQGFTQGVHEYNISPKQWTTLKDKLAEVNDDQHVGVPIGEGVIGVPNTQPFPTWQEPHTYHTNVEIPCVTPNGTSPSTGFVVTTTPGSSIGTITTLNGMSTSTTYAPINGVSYTSHNED